MHPEDFSKGQKAHFASKLKKNFALRADFTSNVGIFRPLVKVAPDNLAKKLMSLKN